METTTFTYANSGWKDLLIAVNDVELTYDENGNVLTYGDRKYTWNTGRHLESIIDGNNKYSYTYDENGIRTSKTVNGVTTYYNTKDGVILSQTDGTNTMYFQYDTNGTPLGFIYNGTQYFYMINSMGDVISITDDQGNELVEYEYDEWGKNISIYTPDDTDERKVLAEANPLRYRGYYYDSETGYYYLQSRYYDATICGFINADDIKIVNTSKNIYSGINIYAYCYNDPINNTDSTGAFAWSTLAKMLLGALSQYAGDIISNIISGRTGTAVFKPVSSIPTYISAALSALVGGNKLLNSLGRAAISTAAKYIEERIKGNKQSVKTVILNLIKNTIVDFICSTISKVAVEKIKSLAPKNYSTFAHSKYLKNKNLTPDQIKKQMQKLVRANVFAAKAFEFIAGSVANAV